MNGGTKKLDMLISNAAQTWTDLVETEMLCVRREEQLCSSVSNGGLIIDTGYCRGPIEYMILVGVVLIVTTHRCEVLESCNETTVLQYGMGETVCVD